MATTKGVARILFVGRLGMAVGLLVLLVVLPIFYLSRGEKSPPPLTTERLERIMSREDGGQWKCVRVNELPVTGGRK